MNALTIEDSFNFCMDSHSANTYMPKVCVAGDFSATRTASDHQRVLLGASRGANLGPGDESTGSNIAGVTKKYLTPLTNRFCSTFSRTVVLL